MTVRAEKSTRLPIKLPLIRPSFAFSLLQIDFIGRPDLCVACNNKSNQLQVSLCKDREEHST